MGQESINFNRIAEAISYIREHFREQPNLDEVAAKVHMSPYHFQRIFTEWAGVSPKKFLQYITIGYAKTLLGQGTVSDATLEAGLSSPGRLHDLFITIEGMTPGEYKNGGESLHIRYSFAETPFGSVIVASTPKGVCHMAFHEDQQDGINDLISRFPRAEFEQMTDMKQQDALQIFRTDWSSLPAVKLHLKGTPFQLKVWETLLKIPMGGLATYGHIARQLDNPNASRAVGSAVGDNPVAFLIPCHRVIQSSGIFGHYHWGPERKTAMLGWEAARVDPGPKPEAIMLTLGI